MDISLDGHFSAKVYTSGDSITGSVTIVPQHSFPFDELEIILLGTAHTGGDQISGPIKSNHIFLKLFMPIDESTYPDPRVLEPGHSYSFPIHFVVPQHLTLSACAHKVASPHVLSHHMRLPPTLGRGNGTGAAAAWERDDMAPEMAHVEYAIKARVFRDTLKDGDSGRTVRSVVLEATQPIRILPASQIDPPLAVSSADRAYKLQSSKTLRKGLFARSKLGRVTASAGLNCSAPLPAPIILRPNGVSARASTATVQLSFDPVRPDVAPPCVTSVSAKLTARTHYSTSGISTFPNLGDWSRIDNVAMERRGVYKTSVNLLNQPLTNFQWEANVDLGRRDSGYYSSDCGSADDISTPKTGPKHLSTAHTPSQTTGNGSGNGLGYAAHVIVPLELPTQKRSFLPTFHSCIVSRTYSLQLSVTVVPASSASPTSALPSSISPSSASVTTLSITLPVQVVIGDATQNAQQVLPVGQAISSANAPYHQQQYDDEDTEGLPSFEHALEEAAADAHLAPRVMAVPEAQYQQTSVLPGYSGRQ
ncbi:hypothetical protein SEPCBS119000_000591 [Sporothrix epigloea]|uniref:Arrestin-like N-terminal domain-containing protein n=1 Tax=Sporothrix epigloea TaxID=1892477 RepID=A0ABP0D7N9_9PEZI